MSVNFDDLPFELFLNIFNYLTTKELFMIELVNKKWQEAARKFITENKSLNIGHENYGNKFIYHKSNNFILIQDNNIEILKSTLSK